MHKKTNTRRSTRARMVTVQPAGHTDLTKMDIAPLLGNKTICHGIAPSTGNEVESPHVFGTGGTTIFVSGQSELSMANDDAEMAALKVLSLRKGYEVTCGKKKVDLKKIFG